MQLSKLEKVDLREVWKHEALDFTNWLAKPENLELLSDELESTDHDHLGTLQPNAHETAASPREMKDAVRVAAERGRSIFLET